MNKVRIRYSEDFPSECPEAGATVRQIRRIVDDRLAAEIRQRLREAQVPPGE